MSRWSSTGSGRTRPRVADLDRPVSFTGEREPTELRLDPDALARERLVMTSGESSSGLSLSIFDERT